MSKGGWREIFSKYQRELPRNATPQERGEATRRASREYHGERSNPSKGDATRVALVVGMAFVGYKLLQGLQAAKETPEQKPSSGV